MPLSKKQQRELAAITHFLPPSRPFKTRVRYDPEGLSPEEALFHLTSRSGEATCNNLDELELLWEARNRLITYINETRTQLHAGTLNRQQVEVDVYLKFWDSPLAEEFVAKALDITETYFDLSGIEID